jgi:hypothetical protein
MKNNKIIGFNLSLNFMFNDNQEHKEVINNIENMIDDLFPNKQGIGAMLLSGKAEFIRKDNDLGIKVLNKESDD